LRPWFTNLGLAPLREAIARRRAVMVSMMLSELAVLDAD
jgi:hypothetical protein